MKFYVFLPVWFSWWGHKATRYPVLNLVIDPYEVYIGIVLKLGRSDWSTWDLVIRDWNRVGLKKKQEKKKPGATRRPDWPGKTRLRPSCKPADFCFFFVFLLKRRRFDLKKKIELTRPTRWPCQNLEPGS